VELEGNDYDTSGGLHSLQLQYHGTSGIGTTAGFNNQNLGALIFNSGSTALVGTNNAIPLIFVTNNTEVGRWDTNGNLNANVLRQGYATTTTAAGTTTLTAASTQQQYFSGTTTQTVKLPVVTTVANGFSFTIVNNSSGIVTVQSSGANTIQAMAASTQLVVTVIDT